MQVVLVHRPRYDDWSFPKGKSERGEHPLLTATREVAEEAGLAVVLGRRLTDSHYEVDGRPKEVRYWAARCTESLGFVPGREVDDLAWLELPQAAARLSYERDRILLDEFAAVPPDTIPLIMLRHTHAGGKLRGPEADLARPLDHEGTVGAKLLARLLACYGSCRVLTSAAERCVSSVQLYARAVGMPVEIEPAFTVVGDERADAGDYKLAARRAADLAAAGRPTLICAHRENLPVMLDAAGKVLGAGADLRPEPPLGKGSFVVLQSADGVLVSAERQDLAGQ